MMGSGQWVEVRRVKLIISSVFFTVLMLGGKRDVMKAAGAIAVRRRWVADWGIADANCVLARGDGAVWVWR